jgi:hypothetical protein
MSNIIKKLLILEHIKYQLMEALEDKLFTRAKVLINRKERIKKL